MNPIQLQLQSEAALPQTQPKEAEKLSKSNETSFESALKKANDSKESEKVSEKPQSEDNPKIAKNESKKNDRIHEDAEKSAEVEDISEKIQQIQIAAQNQGQDVPKELPEVYEDFVVDAEISVDAEIDVSSQMKFASSEIQMDEKLDAATEDFDISKIDIEKILAKADLIEEKASKAEKFADEGIKDIQELAKAALNLDEIELSNIEAENLDENQLRMIAENIQNNPELSENAKFAEKDSLDEVDTKSKKDVKLAVHDLRTRKVSDTELPSEKVVAKVQNESKTNVKIDTKAESETSVQMTMELSARSGAEQNITSSSSQAAGANGSTFQAMLSNTVQANAPEIVKAGNMVLKDNNSGSINLILKPESLGNVKISLNLSDKLVSGQITVASREALDAFRESIDSIKQAFTQSGFDTGSFDLNFSQSNDFAQNFGQNQNDGARQNIHAERTYGDFVADRSADSSADAYNNFSDGSVNIVA